MQVSELEFTVREESIHIPTNRFNKSRKLHTHEIDTLSFYVIFLGNDKKKRRRNDCLNVQYKVMRVERRKEVNKHIRVFFCWKRIIEGRVDKHVRLRAYKICRIQKRRRENKVYEGLCKKMNSFVFLVYINHRCRCVVMCVHTRTHARTNTHT